MDINANVIPFIGGEEEKMQIETQKILGDFVGDAIRPLDAGVSAHCNRVPVNGHLVTTRWSCPPPGAAILAAFENYRSLPQERAGIPDYSR
jgi:aspartate-semialdehyde dehydrogenase